MPARIPPVDVQVAPTDPTPGDPEPHPPRGERSGLGVDHFDPGLGPARREHRGLLLVEITAGPGVASRWRRPPGRAGRRAGREAGRYRRSHAYSDRGRRSGERQGGLAGTGDVRAGGRAVGGRLLLVGRSVGAGRAHPAGLPGGGDRADQARHGDPPGERPHPLHGGDERDDDVDPVRRPVRARPRRQWTAGGRRAPGPAVRPARSNASGSTSTCSGWRSPARSCATTATSTQLPPPGGRGQGAPPRPTARRSDPHLPGDARPEGVGAHRCRRRRLGRHLVRARIGRRADRPDPPGSGGRRAVAGRRRHPGRRGGALRGADRRDARSASGGDGVLAGSDGITDDQLLQRRLQAGRVRRGLRRGAAALGSTGDATTRSRRCPTSS